MSALLWGCDVVFATDRGLKGFADGAGLWKLPINESASPSSAQWPARFKPSRGINAMKPVALRDKDLAVLQAACQRFPAVREVRVFGSRARGTARRASDLDLAISAPDATLTEWFDLCDALENAPLIYELDIVRSERITNERLKDKIVRDGVTVYPATSDKTCW